MKLGQTEFGLTAVNRQRRPEPAWAVPPDMVELGAGEVHVWSADLDIPAAALDACRAILSDVELERANRFRFPVHEHHFVARRWVLGQILSSYVGVEASELSIRRKGLSKPELVWPNHESAIRFSVSHSGSLGLFAISRSGEVGVDVEIVRQVPDMDALACRVMTPPEIDSYLSMSAAVREESFFACWTRKEAYLKATGEGLSREPNTLEVTFLPGVLPRILSVDGTKEPGSRWVLFHLQPCPGFVGALAVRADRIELECFHWERPIPS